jgi:hypothetical protein
VKLSPEVASGEESGEGDGTGIGDVCDVAGVAAFGG